MSNDTTTAPSGQPWAYGVRTWDADGSSYGGFRWDLTHGSRTTAPDWNPAAKCGQGLHCNPYGMGDWSLLSAAPDCKIGLVRYDPALAVDLGGKIKAPWMEVVHVEPYARFAIIMGMISEKRRLHIQTLPTESTTGEGSNSSTTGEGSNSSTTGNYANSSTTGNYANSSTTGEGSNSSTTGYRSNSSTTGYRSNSSTTGEGSNSSTTGNYANSSTTGNYANSSTTGEGSNSSTTGNYANSSTTGNYANSSTTGEGSNSSTTGYRSNSSTTGNYANSSTTGEHSISAALGISGTAKAGKGGAIMLAARNNRGDLIAVFAGMVGQTYSGVTIKPDVAYRLNTDGKLELV